jgi:hypothetical protein
VIGFAVILAGAHIACRFVQQIVHLGLDTVDRSAVDGDAIDRGIGLHTKCGDDHVVDGDAPLLNPLLRLPTGGEASLCEHFL